MQKNDDEQDSQSYTTTSSSGYEPPEPLLQRQTPRFTTFSTLTRQDGYPPPFFKRLDQFIHRHGYRARDVFMAIDYDNDQVISVDEILSGLNRIEFIINKKEERMLREWMQQIVGHNLTFKEFTLALKQRISLTSPQRVSILKIK